MLKSLSSKRMFEKHPGFRKRYPGGSFWSGYEHHHSTGFQDLNDSTEYLLSQVKHHNVKVIDDRQKLLTNFAAERDTAISKGVAEERGGRGL